jgi:hypothetical protein
MRLQVGLIHRFAYIMASFKQVGMTSFKQVGNCNDTGIVSQIVMTFFKIVIIIMTQI